MSRETTIPEKTVLEDIYSYETYLYDSQLRITVANMLEITVDGEIELIVDRYRRFDEIMVTDNNYRAIMSGNPPWATGKPEGTFRIQDLWACVDADRDGTELEIGVETSIR